MTSDQSINDEFSSPKLSCNPLMIGSLILALTKSTTKIEIFNTVVTYLPKLIYADRASVVLLDKESGEARVYSLQGETDVMPVGFPLTLEGTSVGHAIATGTLNIENTDIHSPLLDKAKLAQDGFAIFINAPLKVSHRVLGSINVGSRIPNLYDAQAGEILMQVATLIAVQLEKQELFQSTHDAMESYRIQAERLEVLNDIGRQLASALVKEDVFRWTAEAVARILPANRVSFAVPVGDGIHLEVIDLTGNAAIPKGALLPIKGTSVGKSFKMGESTVIPCLKQSSYPEHQILANSGLQVGWSIPIHIGEEIDGVLNVASAERLGEPEELLTFLNPLAQFLGVTLTRIKVQKAADTALEQKKTEMEYQAHHDALTGLPNRVKFSLLIEQTLEFSQQENNQFAIAFIDLDHFKNVNDSLGHEIGDTLLIRVAERLQQNIRKVDLVARLGGDEFVVVWNDISDLEIISELAKRISLALQQPFFIDGHRISVGCSLGISIYPKDSKESTELIKQADLAMYQAKRTGRNNFQFYCPELTEKFEWHLMVKNSISQAVENDELRLVYQPQIDCLNNCVTSIEGLVRWQHPQQGLLKPHHFISIAEENNSISEITQWVLERSLQDIKQLRQQYPQLYVAVNLSAQEFLKPRKLLKSLEDLLCKYDLPGDAIELEITESILLKDIDSANQIIDHFNVLGTRLALDDFGTGFSSMRYLLELPIHTIKIDRTFVQNLENDRRKSGVVKSVVCLADSLKIKCIAEGVESQPQLKHLQQLGCHNIQGFLVSHPIQYELLLECLQSFHGNKL